VLTPILKKLILRHIKIIQLYLNTGRIRRRIKYIWACVISILPFSFLRVLLYKLMPGYKISMGAKIGFGTKISVEKAQIGNVRIGTFNVFVGPFTLELSDGCSIGSRNIFSCGSWAIKEKFRQYGYRRYLKLGTKSIITSHHFFDVVGGFELGERTWVAGRGSQFWTHGRKIGFRSISIGSRCYISSAVRFCPGTKIGNDCLVALGSVVTKNFDGERLLIGGCPARVLQQDYATGL